MNVCLHFLLLSLASAGEILVGFGHLQVYSWDKVTGRKYTSWGVCQISWCCITIYYVMVPWFMLIWPCSEMEGVYFL